MRSRIRVHSWHKIKLFPVHEKSNCQTVKQRIGALRLPEYPAAQPTRTSVDFCCRASKSKGCTKLKSPLERKNRRSKEKSRFSSEDSARDTALGLPTSTFLVRK